jgi:hypothetical protein
MGHPSGVTDRRSGWAAVGSFTATSPGLSGGFVSLIFASRAICVADSNTSID